MLSKVTLKSAFAAVLAAALMAGPGSAGSGDLLLNGPAQSAAVHDLINSDTQFGLFAAALKQTPLWSMLQQEQSVTLFLPTDKALRDEGTAFLLEFVLLAPSNQERLQEVLSYHVYPGMQLDREAVQDANLRSLRGACFPLYRLGSGLRIGPESVVTEYIKANNGAIFVIDRLLWQPWDGGSHCAGPGGAVSPLVGQVAAPVAPGVKP
jgi:uncharacterized surface protein with fasciclin (FAS1) repeats